MSLYFGFITLVTVFVFEYFKELGFEEKAITHDVKNDDIYLKHSGIENIMTEQEEMFSNKGIKINAGIFSIFNNTKEK